MEISDILDYGRNPLKLNRFYRMVYGPLYYLNEFRPFMAEGNREAGNLIVLCPHGSESFILDKEGLQDVFGDKCMHVSNLSLSLTLALPVRFEDKFVKELLYAKKVSESGIKGDYTNQQLIEDL